jgi:hypothetical protein
LLLPLVLGTGWEECDEKLSIQRAVLKVEAKKKTGNKLNIKIR